MRKIALRQTVARLLKTGWIGSFRRHIPYHLALCINQSTLSFDHAGMIYIDLEDNLSRHPKSTAYWLSKNFYNPGPVPTFTTSQRHAAAMFAAARGSLHRNIPAEPLTVAVGPALKPLVKVAAALGKPLLGINQSPILGRRQGFAMPLTIDVTDNALFGVHVHLNGKK